MKIASLQQLCSLHGGVTVKRVEAIATELRNAGLIPKGGRGPHAPVAKPHEMAIFVLAAAGANRVSDAAKDAQALAGVVDSHGNSLLSILSEAFLDDAKAHAIYHIRVFSHIPMAEVTFREGLGGGRYERFFSPAKWQAVQFFPDAEGQGFVGPMGHIGGAIIHQIALDLASTNEPAEADDQSVGELVAG